MAEERRFDDMGFFSPNKKRTSEKAPTHTGKINISEETLQGLIELAEAGEEVALQLSGWRKSDNPNMVKLKIALPFKGEQGGGGRGNQQRRNAPAAGRRQAPQDRGNRGRRQYNEDDFGDEGDLL